MWDENYAATCSGGAVRDYDWTQSNLIGQSGLLDYDWTRDWPIKVVIVFIDPYILYLHEYKSCVKTQCRACSTNSVGTLTDS